MSTIRGSHHGGSHDPAGHAMGDRVDRLWGKMMEHARREDSNCTVRSVLNEDVPSLKEWPATNMVTPVAGPVRQMVDGKTGTGQVITNIGLIDKALGQQRGIIETLEDRLGLITRPVGPSQTTQGEQNHPRMMHSVAAGQLEDLAAAVLRHNDRLADLLERLEV
jgi:hypothetical protein